MPDRTRKMVAVTTAEAGLDHSLPCPTCGATNPARSRFCSSCGARLEGAGAVREERKLVSVLFVDLVGFTARSDRADPEDVRDVLQLYYAEAKKLIDVELVSLHAAQNLNCGLFGCLIAETMLVPPWFLKS